LIDNDHVVQTLAPNGPDDTFDVGILWSGVFGEGVDQLLGGLGGRRMRGAVHVHDPAAAV
jgi:hypothetical protein